MKKIVLYFMISIIYLHAQGMNKLDDLVITATKTENSIKNITSAIQVISNAEIENSGASNLSDVLNNSANIYVSPNGNTYRIRGMEHSDTLILVDGRRLNGEFSKTFELQRISAGMIERIEILKGASSLLYGSDAMGGVINIITKKAKNDLSGTIQVLIGERKKAKDFFISNKVDKTFFSLYANHLKQDAYTKNKSSNLKIMHQGQEKTPVQLPSMGSFVALKTALTNSLGANGAYTIGNDYLYNLDIKNIGLNVSHNFNEQLSAYFDFSYLKEEKDGAYISDSYPTAYPSFNGKIMAKYVPAYQYNKNNKLNLATGVNYFISDSMDIKYDISYSKYKKDRKSVTALFQELGYSSKNASKFSVNISTLKHLDNALQFTHTLNEDNRYILGAEHRINDTNSTAFNVNNRKYSSIFAQHEYKLLDDLKLIYGARYDDTSEDENETSLSLGGVYTINENMFFRLNYAEGFRSPDDRELYVDQTTPTGKKKLGASVIDLNFGKSSEYKLKSETSKTIELGLVANFDELSFEVAAYQTFVDDRITEVSKNNGTYTSFENISDSEIKGVETTVSFSPIKSLTININGTLIDAKNKDTKEDLIQIPQALTALTFSYFPVNNFELKSITKYIGSQYLDSEDKIGGYTITNLKLNAKNVLKNIDFFAGVDNIFDKRTDENLGLIPQSSFYAGIKYKF